MLTSGSLSAALNVVLGFCSNILTTFFFWSSVICDGLLKSDGILTRTYWYVKDKFTCLINDFLLFTIWFRSSNLVCCCWNSIKQVGIDILYHWEQIKKNLLGYYWTRLFIYKWNMKHGHMLWMGIKRRPYIGGCAISMV